MSADVETPITLPAFPRPTSLYLPDVPRSVPILDTTSYSPFPTFPGSNHRARDPYGLNAYLLHPDNNLWHYVDPMPNPSALGAVQHQRSSSMDEQSSPSITPVRAVKKQRSLSGLRPSPLSQPPVSGEKEDDSESDNKPEMLQRRRSSSLSSSPRLSLEQEVKIVATFRNEAAKTPKTPKSGKKSLRRAFTKARKSVFGTSDTPPVPSMPALPEPRALLAPSMSGSSSESTTDPTTPMTSRSSSNYSSVSSASSTSSSEGVKTPGEGVSAEIAITGFKLADALQEAGEKKNKGKGWKWLGARKGGKLTVKDSDGSGSTTPLSDLSAASTPNSSTPDLLAGGVPKVTLTPSPAITTPRGGSPVLAPSEQLARQHTWASEQLRRVSMRKLGQLRSPSPHPLALSLRRQNSKLPDEVAFSIQSGQRVFPMSVNSHQGAEGDLVPAQGGLWLNIAISRVMQKLEQGEQPDGILKARPSPKKKSTIPRPRGVLDFINRPPYEERNIVFYPDNVFSPISMARPGNGVWDLDFSPYIFALSTIDDSGSTWPAMPRASLETPSDELAEVIKAFGESSMEDEKVETLKSPAPLREQGPDAAFTTLTASAPLKTSTPLASRVLTPAQSPSKSRPLSSFRPAGRHSNTSSASASSSSSGESESEEEDDEPLAVVAKRRSQSFQSQPRPVGTVPLHPAAASSSTGRPSAGVAAGRSLSQPDKRASKRLSLPLEADSSRWKEMQQQSAMNEVARARERREANRVGEVEKRAVSQQINPQQLAKRRSSMMDLRETGSGSQQHVASSSKHKRNSSATALAVPLPRPTSMHIPAPVSSSSQNDARRSRGTSHGLSHPQCSSKQQHLSPARPEAGRAKSGPPPVGEKRGRYHSFYEQRAASTSAPSFHSAHSHSHSNSNSSSNPKIHAHPHGFPQHGVSPYPHPHHAQAHAHMFAQAQGGLQVYPPAYQQHQGVSMYGGMTMPPVLGMPNHPYATQQGVYGSPASSKRVTRMA